MAFPTVAATTSNSGGSTANHTVNMPTGVTAGDLLVAFLACRSTTAFGWPAGWTTLTSGANSTTILGQLAYRIADGSEGASITVTGGAAGSGAQCYRIDGGTFDTTTPVEQGTWATGSSTSADPPSLTPTGGAADFLWLPFIGTASATPPSAAPTNYTDLIGGTGGGGTTATTGSARRSLNAASENPGTFTNNNAAWIAQTLVVRPATLTNKTLAAGAGSFALTGTAATPKVGRVVAAGAGSYALSGQAATLRRNLPMVAGAGSFALTGTAATLKHGWAVAAGSGSFALTGTAASLLRAWKLAAGAGSFALTGTDAAIVLASNPIIIAGPGSFALTGSAASLLRAWIVPAGAGSFALSGTAATLRRNVPVVAGAGSFALTGTDAALKVARLLAAGAGSYALTGADASILHNQSITLLAGSGAYLLSGQSATLTVFSNRGRVPYAAVRASLEDPNSIDALLFFITLSASGLDTPLYLVNDNATMNGQVVTYSYQGHSFTAFPFDIEVLTDNEQAPTGKISIVNVDRRVGEIVRQIPNRVKVDLLTILPSSDFDLTVNPRTLISTARPIYTAIGLEIRNIKVDAMLVTGELVSVDDVSEPWPGVRATQDRLPGLFR